VPAPIGGAAGRGFEGEHLCSAWSPLRWESRQQGYAPSENRRKRWPIEVQTEGWFSPEGRPRRFRSAKARIGIQRAQARSTPYCTQRDARCQAHRAKKRTMLLTSSSMEGALQPEGNGTFQLRSGGPLAFNLGGSARFGGAVVRGRAPDPLDDEPSRSCRCTWSQFRRTRFTPDSLVAACIEGGAAALLLDRPAIPDGSFDLSSRLAGGLLHAMSKYGLRLAAVVDDSADHSRSFRDFVRECNSGHPFRFFRTRSDAIAWLGSIEKS
jgi:hypothetical protein